MGRHIAGGASLSSMVKPRPQKSQKDSRALVFETIIRWLIFMIFKLGLIGCVLENVKGVTQALGGFQPYYEKLLFALRQCVPQFHWRFDTLLLGEDADVNTLPEFWSIVVKRKDPRIKRHPMCLKKDWQHCGGPYNDSWGSGPCCGCG